MQSTKDRSGAEVPESVTSNGARRTPVLWMFAAGALWLASAWFWVVPQFLPRGSVWGHYRASDIVFGVPAVYLALASAWLLLTPPHARRMLALKLTAISLSAFGFPLFFDLAYTFTVAGAWKSNYWLDRAHIPRAYSSPDPELGFVRNPFTIWRGTVNGRDVEYRTDENGFRNPPGIRVADLVFIGDSYTEAAQVSETESFVGRVAAASGLRTVNLGRGAYGPQQEGIVLRRYALGYNPRFIVWQIFSGNDLTDALEFEAWQRNPDQRTSLRRRYINNSLLRKWFLKYVPRRGGIPANLRRQDGTIEEVFLRYAPETSRGEGGFAQLRRSLEEGIRLCRSRGIKLLVLHIPPMGAVLKPRLKLIEPPGTDELPRASGLGSRLEVLCGTWGCDYIDMLPVFRKAAEAENHGLYIPNDEHLDITGHEIVASEILKWTAGKR